MLPHFLKELGISHWTGISKIPQGQAMFEQAHFSQKKNPNQVERGTWGVWTEDTLVKALFAINFLHFNKQGLSPAYKYWGTMMLRIIYLALVYWKDPVVNTWNDPAPLLTMRLMLICVFLEKANKPIRFLADPSSPALPIVQMKPMDPVRTPL